MTNSSRNGMVGFRRILILLLIVVGTAGMTGCATVTRGTTETLLVQSEPSGASVRLSSGFTGVTPTSFTVSRKGDIVVSVVKDGYEPVEVIVKSQIAGKGAAGFAGNVLIGGVIGMGVDAATGASLSHFPNPVKVTLVPIAKPPGEGVPVPAISPPVAVKPSDSAAPAIAGSSGKKEI